MVIQPKADTHPTIAMPITATYPITKIRLNVTPLLAAEPAPVIPVTLFMATLLRSNYADWAPTVANWFKDLVTHLRIGRLAIVQAVGRSVRFWTFRPFEVHKNTPSGSKYRVPAAPVTEPLKSSALKGYQAPCRADVNWFTIGLRYSQTGAGFDPASCFLGWPINVPFQPARAALLVRGTEF